MQGLPRKFETRTLSKRFIGDLFADGGVACAFAVLALMSVFFWFFPATDLETSALFYRKGAGFFLTHDAVFEWIRHFGIDLTWAYGIIAIGLLVAGWRARSSEAIRRGGFLVAVMLLGPGLFVNLILKDNWGRARPRDVLEFGGSLPYSKVWEIVPYCKSNCSFVSGEGAAAFALMATIFIVPQRYRWWLGIPLLAIVSLVSFDRIMFGGHFLSDTALSWAIVLVVMVILDRLMLRRNSEIATRLPSPQLTCSERSRGGCRSLSSED